MWRRRFLSIAATLAFLSGAGAITHSRAQQSYQGSDGHRLDILSFEYVWRTVSEKHFDPTFGGVDWPAARLEFLPRVEAAGSRSEARDLMMELLRRLNLTHFAIIPGELYETVAQSGQGSTGRGSSGIDARVVEGRALVTKVERDSDAWLGGVRPGWEVLSVRNRELPSLLSSLEAEIESPAIRNHVRSAVACSLLRGGVGDTLVARFRDAEDREVELRVPFAEPAGRRFQAGHLPPVWVRTDTARLESDIGYIAFNQFLDAATVMPAFNEAMKSFMDAKGVVIDVRGNPGGQAEMITGMAGWFIAEKGRHLGTLKMRAAELKLVVRPRPQVYGGPVAILVDELSTCAAEIMALGMQETRRARVFGAPTGGATLGSNIERLQNGDGFQYAFADFYSTGGKRIEGIGVGPDVEVRPTRESLLQGRDVVLEAAVAWILSRHGAGSAGLVKDRK